jgi:hypothetical protein
MGNQNSSMEFPVYEPPHERISSKEVAKGIKGLFWVIFVPFLIWFIIAIVLISQELST